MTTSLLELLDQRMHTNYPIKDDCVVKDITGVFLPSSFLVELHILIPNSIASDATKRFFLSSIETSGSLLDIGISYRTDNNTSFVCARVTGISTSLTSGDSIDSRTFNILPAATIPEDHKDLRAMYGTIIIGSCIDMVSLSSLKFTYANAPLLPSLIFTYNTDGISSVTAKDATNNQTIMASNFIIRAGDGIDLRIEEAIHDSKLKKVLIIDRVATTEDLQREYNSVEEVIAAVEAALTPIKSINGIYPGAGGNINIEGADCTGILSTNNGIAISNTCATPCCTSQDNTEALAALQSLADVKIRLLGYFESLATNINAMQSRLSSLIASRR